MNLPSCFKLPFVGVRGACDQPSSGLFIDSSLRLVSKLANDLQVRGENFVKEKELEAIRVVIRDFELLLSDCYTLQTVLSEKQVYGDYREWKNVEYFGLEFKTKRSKQRKYLIENLFIFPEDNIKTELVIYEDAKEVKRLDVTLYGGQENNICVDYEARGNVRLVMNLCNTRVKLICRNTCENVCQCDDCVSVYSIVKEEGCDGNWICDNRYRLGFCVICKADYDYLYCHFKHKFAGAVKVMLESLILQEVLFGDELSQIIENKKSDADKLLAIKLGNPDQYGKNILDPFSEYGKEIKGLVNDAKNFLSENKNNNIINTAPFRVTDAIW